MSTSRMTVSLLLIAQVAIVGCSGTQSPSPALNNEFFTIREVNGSMAFDYGGKWTLIFEGIPANSAPIGNTSSINLPGPPGSGGGSEYSSDNLTIKQSWNDQTNSVSVNGFEFKIADAGRQLQFADRTYAMKDSPTTIVIAKDGKTREEPGAGSKP